MRLEDDGSIPADNPFVGDPTVRDEIFALGLRNPWRMSFDPLTGDLYIGDVGEDGAEEVNVVPAGMGGLNFGWNVIEGDQCVGGVTGCSLPCPDPTAGYVVPIWQYGHGLAGCCVIGGHVYRGSAIPQLQGKYLFADYCRANLWTMTWDGVSVTGFADVTDDLRPDLGLGIDSIVSFGTDAAGEIYIVDNAGQDLGKGEVFKVVPGDAFLDGGHALAGTHGEPLLQGAGTLVAGTSIDLTMTGALEHTVAYFVYGFFEVNMPFYGGTLVPDFNPPGNFVILPTGPSGAISISDTWPAGAPAGLTLYFQYWFIDAAGPFGHAASNAIGAIVP